MPAARPRSRPFVSFEAALTAAQSRRAAIISAAKVTAFRVLDGQGDGLRGVYVDRYGPAAVLSVHDDAGWDDRAISAAADDALRVLAPWGVSSVYVKRFARDRSRLGGRPPAESTRATPRSGVPQPEALLVEEYGARFEVRLYDGFSTGLFLEHREHRRALAQLGRTRALNLFAYTCAFAIPLALAGTEVVNVDVSSRFLDWGRRNADINGLSAERVAFTRLDAFAYLAYAKRRGEQFDLVVLDPPTFGAGDARRGVRPWRAATDYAALINEAVDVLAPGGMIFAATNTRELADAAQWRERLTRWIPAPIRWRPLPPWPDDVREARRVAAALLTLA